MTFNIGPYNTSAVVGENGTMACIVTLAQGENVQWKKVSYLFALCNFLHWKKKSYVKISRECISMFDLALSLQNILTVSPWSRLLYLDIFVFLQTRLMKYTIRYGFKFPISYLWELFKPGTCLHIIFMVNLNSYCLKS